MPTIRSTKRLLMPIDKRAKTIVETIIDDQSLLRGISNSDAILQDIIDSQLPKGEFARFHAERVYANDCSLLSSLSAVLRWNVTGSIGKARQSNYKPLVEFGLQLIHRKGLGLALPNQSTVIHHLKSRFEGAVEALERTKDDVDDSFEGYELDQKVKFGKDLVRELDPEHSACAPTYSIVLFAVENFDAIGQLNCSCAYLSDVFEILAEVEEGDWGSRVALPDTPAERAEWAHLLGNVTKGWGRP